MTRKKAVKKLQNILEYWEGCQLNNKAASEILEMIEKDIGMLPPGVNGKYPEVKYEWEVKIKSRGKK